jgi:ketosteroid isomerase-like protein
MDEFAQKQAVTDLVARYADYCDRKDWAAVVGLFTDDAVFDAESVYGKTMRGPEELRKFFESATVAAGHHPTSVYCTDIAETDVSARTKMMVLFRSGLFSVDYDWQLRNEDGGLRIARQEINLVGKVPVSGDKSSK